jgi:DNA repair protein RadC
MSAGDGARDRLELLGPAALSSAELLGLLWGVRGAVSEPVRRVAETCLAEMDGLDGLGRATAAEFRLVPGVGPARAVQLAAAVELGRRVAVDWPTGRWTIRSPRDVADRMSTEMGRLEREELRVVLLNTRNAVLAIQTVYVGNVSAAVVRVGELFRDAVRRHAAGLILVHNHPSGDPTPSPDDLHLTAEAIAAGRLLDVAVLDHLVIGHDAYVSLRDRGVGFDRGHRDGPGNR